MSSVEKQKDLVESILFTQAVKKGFETGKFSSEIELESITYIEEYERMRSLAGDSNSERIMLYEDPETGEWGGLDEFIRMSFNPDNPLLEYWNQIKPTDH